MICKCSPVLPLMGQYCPACGGIRPSEPAREDPRSQDDIDDEIERERERIRRDNAASPVSPYDHCECGMCNADRCCSCGNCRREVYRM